MTRRAVRIANISGFWGDRRGVAKEMIEGGEFDVITGDYLAELTMYLLHKATERDPGAGYVKTFLRDVDEILDTVATRGTKVVVNAGGLKPGALAAALRELIASHGLQLSVASVDGDDVLPILGDLQASGEQLAHLDTGTPLATADVQAVTANAYLGAWPIVAALSAGADIVVTGRVTDASLVVGPAAWWHGWTQTDYDALAGAVVAGHVIECGPQATGGNYPFPDELAPGYPGYPIVELAHDGGSVITKNSGTGGAVTVGTVTSQLLYEIGGPDYAGPDVITWFDTIRLDQDAPDRVRISGVRGTRPSGRVKVAINYAGGYRNAMTIVITGLDIEDKAQNATSMLFDALGGRSSFDETDVQLLRFDKPDAATEAESAAHLVITVKDRDPGKVGRRFADAVTGLFLSSFAGFYTTTPPTGQSAYGVYWPTLIPSDAVTPRLTLEDGTVLTIPLPDGGPATRPTKPSVPVGVDPDSSLIVRAPLGRVAGARSGDKGGNVNIGAWVREPDAYRWLAATLTVDGVRALIPEARDLPVHVYPLPNLLAINIVIVGLLGEGVASTTRPDPQGKALGEYLRSRLVDIPQVLVATSTSRHPEPPAAPMTEWKSR